MFAPCGRITAEYKASWRTCSWLTTPSRRKWASSGVSYARVRTKSAERDPNTVTREDLESLAKSISEMDRKWVGDKELILKEIRSLISKEPAGGKKSSASKISAKPEKYFQHKVVSGETISTIDKLITYSKNHRFGLLSLRKQPRTQPCPPRSS